MTDEVFATAPTRTPRPWKELATAHKLMGRGEMPRPNDMFQAGASRRRANQFGELTARRPALRRDLLRPQLLADFHE